MGVEKGPDTGTISRAVSVLRAVADARTPPTLKVLAQTLHLPLSTMHRLLDLLGKQGMVDRDEVTRTYRPGFEFFRLASMVVHRMPLQDVARPFLLSAAEQGGESAYLGLLDQRLLKILFITHAASEQLLDYRVPMNVPYSLSRGSSGLAVLAWLEPAQIERVIEDEHSAGRMTREALRTALQSVREQGCAHTRGQRIPGAVGFFAPVFDARERICASFGFTVPEARYDVGSRVRLSEIAMHHAGELSRAIGYPGAWPRPAELHPDHKPVTVRARSA